MVTIFSQNACACGASVPVCVRVCTLNNLGQDFVLKILLLLLTIPVIPVFISSSVANCKTKNVKLG